VRREEYIHQKGWVEQGRHLEDWEVDDLEAEHWREYGKHWKEKRLKNE